MASLQYVASRPFVHFSGFILSTIIGLESQFLYLSLNKFISISLENMIVILVLQVSTFKVRLVLEIPARFVYSYDHGNRDNSPLIFFEKYGDGYDSYQSSQKFFKFTKSKSKLPS